MPLIRFAGRLLGIRECDLVERPGILLKRLLVPLLFTPLYFYIFTLLEEAHFGSYYVVSSRLDDFIPFCPWFIFFYDFWFAYCVWGVAIFAGRKDDTDYRRICLNLGIGMALFLLVSYMFPNVLGIRHVVHDPQNIAEQLVMLIQKADTPKNVLPSIHVFNSIAIADAVCHSRAYANRRRVKITVWTLSLLIVASTVFLKQHSVIDVALAFMLQLAIYPFLYGSRSYVTERVGRTLIRE